jgi:hypothetical protein
MMATGRPILSLEGLQKAADAGKAVTCPKSPSWAKPQPAAFIIHLSGAQLIPLLRLGLYVYVKPQKEAKKP